MEKNVIYQPYKSNRYTSIIMIIAYLLMDIMLYMMYKRATSVSGVHYFYMILAGTIFVVYVGIREYRRSFFTLIINNEGVEVNDRLMKRKEFITWNDIPYMYSLRKNKQSVVVLSDKKCTKQDIKRISRGKKPVKKVICFHDFISKEIPGMKFLLDHYKDNYVHFGYWS